MVNFTKSFRWTQRQVDQEKARVKRELDRATKEGEPASRLEAARQRLATLASDDTKRGRLRRYIYAMSALVHHERYGGLTPREVEDLVTLTHAILQVQGVRPRASRLASLFGDVHQIRSQIFRKEAEPWRAAWEHQLALQLAGEFPSGGLGFQLLAAGNRSLRLGHAELAASQFEASAKESLPPEPDGRRELGRIHAAWLQGDLAGARARLADALRRDFPEAIRKELLWHEFVQRSTASGDFSPLFAATRRGGSHHDATYVLEACYWALATESRDYLERLPSLPAMRRSQSLRPQQHGLWYEAATALQECYDHGVPLPLRLKSLSETLDRRSELLTIDKELLLLAAAARWLARSKSSSLALLVFSEYRALCLKLSGGRQEDTLGVLGDMRQRSWSSVYRTTSR